MGSQCAKKVQTFINGILKNSAHQIDECHILIPQNHIYSSIIFSMTNTTRGIFHTLFLLVALLHCCLAVQQYKLSSGKIYFQVKQTPSSSPELFSFNYDSSIKSELRLTQSSKIQIEGKLKFSSLSFQPELVSFRLRHDKHDKLTEPVQALYDSQSESFKCVVDLGDPKTIQPYSDLYRLEMIIADELLDKNVQNSVANIRISFRYSLSEQKVPNRNSPIAYKAGNIIETRAPEVRVDPPHTFTTFVLLMMVVLTVFFYYGVFVHLKANFGNIPTHDSAGMILNVGLIALFGLNLAFLMKFWLEWTFITTMGNMFWLIVVTALVGNYALLYMKKSQK